MEWKNLRQVLDKCGEELKNEYKRNLEATGNVASGNLANNITYRVVIDDDSYDVILTLEDYFIYVENGRNPGKFPPVDAILSWIRIKPIIPRADDKGNLPTEDTLAFLIGRKIAKEGIKGNHMFEKTKETVYYQYKTMIEEAIEQDVVSMIEKEITI